MGQGRTVRVVPDVSGLDKVFDYRVPEPLAGHVEPGSLVRVDLHGRRVAGWVVDLDVDPPEGVELREIAKLSSLGPTADIIDLARWASHRWAGRLGSVLRAASPETMVSKLLPSSPSAVLPEPAPDLAELFTGDATTIARIGPTADVFPYVLAAANQGDAIVVTPSVSDARHLGARLRRAGGRVALAGRDWGLAASGGTVIGARKAAWARVGDLAAVLVLDEHDESLQEERNPTWHARDVAMERARRAGVPCLLVSPAPSLAGLAAASRVVTPSRNEERAGWPAVIVVDRRSGDPTRGGLFSDQLAMLLRRTAGRVVCVLNRKGRAQMLACASCGELVRTADGEHLMAERDGELVSTATGERRPLVCAVCAGTTLKRLRLGVNRAREELEALAGEAVAEVTAETDVDQLHRTRIVVGTEAALHRVTGVEVVVFLDFDQELLAGRYRAAEQAMALLVRAARLVGGRRDGGRIMIQTRSPDHRVVRSAVLADPGRLVAPEIELRRAAGFPPFGALAEISGPGAGELVEPLRGRLGIDVMGPRADGRLLVRTSTADRLADELAGLSRPKSRVRIAVDPPRV